MFSEEEARIIYNIPLSPLLPRDRLIWRGTLDGIFIVRSAYHLRKELQDAEGGQRSHVEKGPNVWKALWFLKVPNPMKFFIWRACNDLLPTRVKLYRKKVTEIKLCPCCNIEEEDTLHALWSCPAAKDVWGCSHSCFQKLYCEGTNFSMLVEFCMGKLCKDELDLMAVISRRIWLRRNAMVFEGKFAHPNDVFSDAAKYGFDSKGQQWVLCKF